MNKLTTEEILHCPVCKEVMLYNKEDDYWRCPNGCGEFLPDSAKAAREAELASRERARVAEVELRKQILWSLGRAPTIVLPPGPPKPGGRSRSGKRRKRAPVRKRLVTERFLLE